MVVTSASDIVSSIYSAHDRFGLEHELGIAEGAHFRNVEPFELDLRRHALTP